MSPFVRLTVHCLVFVSTVYAVDKRLLLSTDPQYLASTIHELELKFQEQQKEIDALKLKQGSGSGLGTTYVRWGKKSCPANASVVYHGYAAGKGVSDTGSGANLLCLHETPRWGKYLDGDQGARAHLFGAEYEPDYGSSSNLVHGLIPDIDNDQNTPCTVCRTHANREILMIPGTNQCEAGWQLEYTGYLMASRHIDKGPTEFICVDGTADYIPGGRNSNQCLLYPVEARCGTLSCPPFVEGREVTCVVCSG